MLGMARSPVTPDGGVLTNAMVAMATDAVSKHATTPFRARLLA
jgi:hypothetical protein